VRDNGEQEYQKSNYPEYQFDKTGWLKILPRERIGAAAVYLLSTCHAKGFARHRGTPK
jgi:hypothetical protein